MGDTEVINIDPNKSYVLVFDAYGEPDEVHFDGKSLIRLLVDMTGAGSNNKLEDIQHELRQIYSAMSRSVEEGDSLKIGVVVGQTLVKLSVLMYN